MLWNRESMEYQKRTSVSKSKNYPISAFVNHLSDVNSIILSTIAKSSRQSMAIIVLNCQRLFFVKHHLLTT